MPKSRRPRLSWFRFYADDFLGGTGALTAPECGRYLLLLLHQWGTKDRQLLPSEPERLRVICRGEDPGPLVLSKFTEVDGGLRNERLAAEWDAAAREYNLKAEGGGSKTPGHSLGQIPPRIGPPTKNQEPRPTLQVGRKNGNGADLPADVQGERLLHQSRVARERKFYALIQRLSELQPEKDPPDIAREVTCYTAKDGRQVKGVVRPEGMSEERLDRSLEDAQWWIDDLEAKRGPKPSAAV